MSRHDVTIDVLVETDDEELRKKFEADYQDEWNGPFEEWIKEAISEITTVSVSWPGLIWLGDLDITVD